MNTQRSYYLNMLGLTIWKYRDTPESQEIRPLSQAPSIEWIVEHPAPEIIFFCDCASDEEFELLMAIVKACAKNKPYAIGKALASTPITAKTLVFGEAQARTLDPSFSCQGLFEQDSHYIYVTYPLSELLWNPDYKKELWRAWQSL